MITDSKETKAPIVKAQDTGGLCFNYPMVVSHNTDVDNIKYTITHTFCLIKYRSTLLVGAHIELTSGGVDSILNAVHLKHV